jgi:hypothetical protein
MNLNPVDAHGNPRILIGGDSPAPTVHPTPRQILTLADELIRVGLKFSGSLKITMRSAPRNPFGPFLVAEAISPSGFLVAIDNQGDVREPIVGIHADQHLYELICSASVGFDSRRGDSCIVMDRGAERSVVGIRLVGAGGISPAGDGCHGYDEILEVVVTDDAATIAERYPADRIP